MAFDHSKENVQPLRGGRNTSQLEVALQAQSNQEFHRELMQQKEEFENTIRSYEGNDPLGNWYQYISWVEQSFPKNGHEGNIVQLLESCLAKFENDMRYSNDRRFCKLWIKYIDLQDNPLELYHMMHSRGLCRGCTDMFRAWAYYHEAAGDFRMADMVFQLGIRDLAQPYDELVTAHQNMVFAAGQQVISGVDERRLAEQRKALTCLQTYKPGGVASVRTASANNAGILPVASGISKSNIVVPIYEDDHGEGMRGDEAAPVSIISVARRREAPKENTLKPGVWTAMSIHNTTPMAHRNLPFTVHEDCLASEETMSHTVSAVTLEDYSNWTVPLCYPEPDDPSKITMYPKTKVYIDSGTEYSLEEIKALRYACSNKHFDAVETEQAIQSILDNNAMQQSLHEDEQINEIQNEVEFIQNPKLPPELPLPLVDATVSVWPQSTEVLHNFPSTSTAFGLNLSDFWKSPTESSPKPTPIRPNVPNFVIFEESNVAMQEQPKASAMTTLPFKILSDEDLAETGSRGGLDAAAAAQPVDSAKRIAIFEDDSLSCPDPPPNLIPFDSPCNTQLFNFNLTAMKVSTPHSKQGESPEIAMKDARKQLFDGGVEKKQMSTILEETRSSSSGGSTIKSSLTTKRDNMVTITEEQGTYDFNLAQNLKANAALRTSLLGEFMECESEEASPVSAVPIDPIQQAPSDPFRPSVIKCLLEHINFPGPHNTGYTVVNSTPRVTVRKEVYRVGNDTYYIEKVIGKGTYGTVYKALEGRTSRFVALKCQKPPHRWEFYICREIQARLSNHPLRDHFMDITVGYFSDVASILISEFNPCGSLLDLANLIKLKTGRPMKECICIYFCIEMLNVVSVLHRAEIIHADIKPDNFLVQLTPDGCATLQLIDFGCSIDMRLFPAGTMFTRRVTTEDFVCCEMRDGRPWSYHTDLFCIAATAHVLLFDKYIQLQKKDGFWSIARHLSRYMSVDLWNMFFSTLLNQQSGPANADCLRDLLTDKLNSLADYKTELRSVANFLKGR